MNTKGLDRTFFGLSLLLVIVGLLALGSASAPLSEKQFGHPYYYVLRQIILGVGGGIILFIIGLRIPIQFYKKYAAHLLLASIAVLILVFIPGLGGATLKGASRWIHIGPLSFQPSEMLKLTLIMYLASWMSSKRKEILHLTSGYIPFLVIIGVVSSFLYFEPDIGTLGVIALSSLALFGLGVGKLKWIIFTIILGILLLFVLSLSGYRQDRVSVFTDYWLNHELDVKNEGYQFNQALIAIGSGGFFGRGFGLSRQKFLYLPEPGGDTIFAIFAEEFGFLGSSLLIGLFIAFFIRGMIIAMHAKDYFSELLASGIVLLIAVQIIINIGALTGLLPLTGITLPFMSYGGTALAFLLFEIGILLRISQKAS